MTREEALKLNAFAHKKRIVLEGKSKTLKDWQAHSTITSSDFIDALEWLCSDPLDDKGHMTREIALTPTSIKKLRRCSYKNGDFAGFYDWETGELWGGEFFRDPVPEHQRLAYGDYVELIHKVRISCRDRID